MTLRRLVVMANARQRADWSRVSPLLVMVSNYLRDTKQHPEPIKHPQALNPYARPQDLILPKPKPVPLRDLLLFG